MFIYSLQKVVNQAKTRFSLKTETKPTDGWKSVEENRKKNFPLNLNIL